MKKLKMVLAVMLIAVVGMHAQEMFQSVPEKEATLLQSGKEKLYCPNCGMNLPKYYKTSHAVELADGTHRQYCSIHCLVEEMEMGYLRDKKESIKSVQVVDVASNQFTDAKKAFYVVGSKKPGTMTMTSKYAFAQKAQAEEFASQNGGTVMNFDETYKTAVSDFTKDMGMLLAMKSSKMWKMGEKLYNEKCDKAKIETFHAHSIATLKSMIRDSKVCGELDDMQLQAISLHIWDQKLGNFEKQYGTNEEIKANAEMFKKKMMEQKNHE